ncbi:interleukin 12 receptor, beta 2a, like isoform X1 [Polypterus senegalus]|uniref:interleukin 12 receptor, beta 2a, like isoform X1 n=2 Tax=Polypterus senegalus TaxID=55291 RepID=UPI0019646DB3|nr:interleukin 12 receptor, beta 2a, like isoform X1 [Polypterus senegalus]
MIVPYLAVVLVGIAVATEASSVSIQCLWQLSFQMGRTINRTCAMSTPLPPGCTEASLQLHAGSSSVTTDFTREKSSISFTRPSLLQVLGCVMICHGLTSRPHCDVTVTRRYSVSNLRCFFTKELQCSWEYSPGTPDDTNFTFHLNSRYEWSLNITARNTSVTVQRFHYIIYHNVQVWLSTSDAAEEYSSEIFSFDTSRIDKLPPPNITEMDAEHSLISVLWYFPCNEVQERNCRLRYRADGDSWTEVDGEDVGIEYNLEDPQPYTLYWFQVRCTCNGNVWSDWSEASSVRSMEESPVGPLDVFIDLTDSPALVWKTLPMNQARGKILGYVVRFTGTDGINVIINSTMEDFNCSSEKEEEQQRWNSRQICNVPFPENWTGTASIIAFSAAGKTKPTELLFTGLDPLAPADLRVHVVDTPQGKGFTLSWRPPPAVPSRFLQEYLVQSRQLAKGQCSSLEWKRLNMNSTSTTLNGDFKPFVPYVVSVFAVYTEGISHPASCLAYADEAAPSAGPPLSSFSVTTSTINVSWEEIPLIHRKGFIHVYRLAWGKVQLGITPVREHMVNVSQRWYVIKDLNPKEKYQIWVCGITNGQEGKCSTRTHIMIGDAFNQGLLGLFAFMFLVFIMLIVAMTFHQKIREWACPLIPVWCYQKVPKPVNCQPDLEDDSHHHINFMSTALGSSLGNILTDLEVVERPVTTEDPTLSETAEEEDDELHKDYSMMNNSDFVPISQLPEEEAMDCDWKPVISGYEKHFMPSPDEI